MRHAMHIREDGAHHNLLQALRHLRDPELVPLFEYLAASGELDIRVHGMLGLVEINPTGTLPAALLSNLNDAKVESLVITAALDDELLPPEQAAQMLGQPQLDPGLRLVMVTRLERYDDPQQQEWLRTMLETENIGRRSYAALLLHQGGDKAGTDALTQLNQSDQANRNMIRAELLQNAMRHDMDRVVTWAHQISEEPDLHPVIELLVIRTMIQFGDERGLQLWREKYESTGSLAQRIRLAATLLENAPQVEPDVYQPLLDADDPLLVQMGRTGQAIASGSPQLVEQVLALFEMGNPVINRWVMAYADADAGPENGAAILAGVIQQLSKRRFAPDNPGLQLLVDATHAFYDKDPAAAAAVIRPILADPATDRLAAQAILLGLVHVRDDGVYENICVDLPQMRSQDADGLVLLLKVRSGAELNEQELNDLALLVRGGGRLQDNLRMHAAWGYLKQTGQSEKALAALISNE